MSALGQNGTDNHDNFTTMDENECQLLKKGSFILFNRVDNDP